MNRFLQSRPANLALRAARAGDEAFLLKVYASTRAEELAAAGWNDEQREAFLRMQFQAQDKHYRENYPGAEFQIIQVDGERAGRLYVHHRSKEIRIMDIALLPAYRRRGLGTVLLKAILSEGAQAGKAVTIHVEIFNPALGWYERLGFTKIAEHGPYQLMECSPCGNACRLEAGQRVGPPA
jgi:ribosomal protein S18 acetylase RimI-like enzyme